MSEQVRSSSPIKFEDYTTVMSSIQHPLTVKIDPSQRRQADNLNPQEAISPNSSARSIIFGRHQMYGAVNIPRALDSQGSSDKGNLYSTNVNFDLQMKRLKNNVLIGTNNNNFQLPVVFSGANSTLVGFYNNRQKLESQQNKRHQAVNKNKMSSINNKVSRGSSLGKAGIEQINLPLRGRPVTIGDRTRDIFMRAHYFKQCYEDNEVAQENLQIQENLQPLQSSIQRGHTADPRYNFSTYDSQPKQLVKSQVFNFQSNGTKHSKNANQALHSTYNTLAKANPSLIPAQQEINDKSMENILRFLDLGKQDYDEYKKGMSVKGANVVDLNQSADIPQNYHTKKNKNDFYRFLLAQNKQYQDGDYKVNNDILIPRSILKKNGDQIRQRKGSHQNLQNLDNETLDFSILDETIYGQHLNKNNPLLSPKFNQFLQDQQFQMNNPGVSEEEQNLINGVGTSITPTPNNAENANGIILDDAAAAVMPVRKMQIPLSQTENNQDLLHDQQQQRLEDDQHTTSYTKIQQPIYNNPSSTLLINQIPLKPDNSQKQQQNSSQFIEQPRIINTTNQVLLIQQPLQQQNQQSTKQLRKHIIRQTNGGGFFPTQVDVIEREILVDESNNNIDNQGLGLAFYKGMQLRGITNEELKKLQLNQDRIFGFNSYGDFQQKYFKGGLVAMDDMNKANRIKNARQKYSKINSTNLRFQM